MSLKLQSVGFNRHATPPTFYASLQDDQSNSINVTVKLEPHHQIDELTIAQIQHLALEAAKHLHL